MLLTMVHVALVVLLLSALALVLRRLDQIFGWRLAPSAAIERHLTPFRLSTSPTTQNYAGLFAYFLEGFLARSSRSGAYARYPGWPSREGSRESIRIDQMEGFSRIAPLIAAWLSSGRSLMASLEGDLRLDLRKLLSDAIVSGTNPESRDYWGDIRDFDQRIVEASDVALALWLSRDSVWPNFSLEEKSNIVKWLQGAVRRRTLDNNWRLFPILIGCVLRGLGEQSFAQQDNAQFEFIKSLYRGGGWFVDGPDGPIDYYNAWGFHYSLFWIRVIDSNCASEFIDRARREFATCYRHFFGPNGFPVMGRSICYRMAAPAPLIASAILDPDLVAPGEARRALDSVWSYFIRNGAVRAGMVTQGYLGPDLRMLDYYSGPASGLWSLRSLIIAFWLPDDSPFWTTCPSPLPVETRDFEMTLTPFPFRLVGTRDDLDVRLIRSTPSGHSRESPLIKATFRDKALNFFLYRSRWPDNHDAKYLRDTYSSRNPFCIDNRTTSQ